MITDNGVDDVGAPIPNAPGSGAAAAGAMPDRRGWHRVYGWAVRGTDTLATVAALSATAFYYDVRHPGSSPAPWTWLTIAVIVMVCLVLLRTRDHRILGIGSEEMRRIGRAGLVSVSATSVVAVGAGGDFERVQVLIGPMFAAAAVGLGRLLLRRRLHRLRAGGSALSSVLASGDAEAISDLVARTNNERWAGWRVDGICVPGQQSRGSAGEARPHGGDPELIPELVQRHGYDVVAVLPSAHWTPLRLRRLSWALEGSGAELVVAPVIMEVAGPRLHVSPVFGMPLLHVTEPVFKGSKRLTKDVVDRAGALFGVVVLAPVLLLIAALVRLTSDGPALYRQQRIGRDGRPFTMVKFRSMRSGADTARIELVADNEAAGPLFKMRQDPRVTPVGAVLRRYSLDELPQLFNVLSGSMSLVGPRPPLQDEVSQYAHHDHRRLLVKPGLTGLWQVSGRSDLTWDESIPARPALRRELVHDPGRHHPLEDLRRGPQGQRRLLARNVQQPGGSGTPWVERVFFSTEPPLAHWDGPNPVPVHAARGDPATTTRGTTSEARHPPHVRGDHRDLWLRELLHHAQHEGQRAHPGRGLLAVPPVLHGQAEDPGHTVVAWPGSRPDTASAPRTPAQPTRRSRSASDARPATRGAGVVACTGGAGSVGLAP